MKDVLFGAEPWDIEEVVCLVHGLDDRSRYRAARSGGREHHGWTTDRYALVAVVNELRSLNHNYVRVHAPAGGRVKEPSYMRFPGEEPRSSFPNSAELKRRAQVAREWRLSNGGADV